MPCITNMTARARRRFSLFLAAALLCLSAGAAAAPAGDSLTLGIISVTTQRTNPLRPSEREFMSLTSLVYEGLVRIDDDYLPKPCLAEKWEASPSGDTWYFTLRDNLFFHDGTPLNAGDVVATANEILRLAAETGAEGGGAYASLRYFISGISASDGRTVVVKTKRNNFAFLYAMNFPVLPAAQLASENPPGTGPFRVEIFVPKDYMLLSANSSWWSPRPKISEIMTIFHAANRELITSYEYNRVDAVLTRSLTAAQYRSGISSLNLSFRTRQLETLMMNNRVPELKDIRVRKAIRYALNLDAIVSTTYMDMVAKTDTPLPAGTWMHNDATGAGTHDSGKAVALLEEAGWTDTDGDGIRDTVIDGKKANLVLRFFVYEEQENSVRVSTAFQIADMLAAVGIRANVTAMSFNEAKTKLEAGSFDLCLAAFHMDASPDPGFLLMGGNTGNYGRYRSEAMDKLFDELRSSLSQDAYRRKLWQIQAQFAEDCPFICLYYRNGAVITRRMFTDARDIREPEVLRGVEGAAGD